jgi:tetratricopeptide (TPR) repeat protein
LKRPFHLVLLAGFFAVFLAYGLDAEAKRCEETFLEANQAYREGRFQDAIKRYEHLIRSGHENGHFYYNLGNAYFETKQLGRAILNYERARQLIPRDADLNFNLKLARDRIQDAVQKSQSPLGTAFFWIDSLDLGEVFWIFALFNFLFWLVMLIRLFVSWEWTYYLFLILIVFLVISGLSFGLKWYQFVEDGRVVIVQKEVDVLAGPDSHDTVLFKLHEGTIVHHERSEDGWSLVSLPDKKRGWLKAGEAERIRQ